MHVQHTPMTLVYSVTPLSSPPAPPASSAQFLFFFFFFKETHSASQQSFSFYRGLLHKHYIVWIRSFPNAQATAVLTSQYNPSEAFDIISCRDDPISFLLCPLLYLKRKTLLLKHPVPSFLP